MFRSCLEESEFLCLPASEILVLVRVLYFYSGQYSIQQHYSGVRIDDIAVEVRKKKGWNLTCFEIRSNV